MVVRRLPILATLLLMSACDSGGVSEPPQNNDDAGNMDVDAGMMGRDNFNPDGWMKWPVPGEEGIDWTISNYVDQDESEGSMVDYKGRSDDDAKTYDNHTGVDITLANFRVADDGVPIYPVAPGKVSFTADGFDDRRTEFLDDCYDMSNGVTIVHENGYRTHYGHMRMGSVKVKEGDEVTTNTELGLIASSGCSTWPHVHLGVKDEDGNMIDPFEEDMFMYPPEYTPPLRFMDLIVHPERIDDQDPIIDPVTEPASYDAGSEIGIAVVLSGGEEGDFFSIEAKNDIRQEAFNSEMTKIFPNEKTRSHWWFNRTLPEQPDDWTFEVYIKGSLTHTKTISAD